MIKKYPVYTHKQTIESQIKKDNGSISPKLYLSYICDWALLFGLYSILQECFHQQTPEPIPPGPSHRHRAAPSRNVIQYLCILRIREKSVSSNIMTTDTGDTVTCAGATVCMAVIQHIGVTQESVSWPPICDLVSSLMWEKYQKLVHTADTDIHFLATLPSAVQK